MPAFEVGGDYYDFFNLGDDRLGFVIADVSGKGISAAFIMAEIKGIFESIAKIIPTPKEVLVKANEILQYSLDKKNFVTAVYGTIDIKKGIINFSRAGHMPAILIRDGNVIQLRPDGIGLGLDYSQNFECNLQQTEIILKENDIFLLFTDGITESKNSELEDYGFDRFEKVLIMNDGKHVDEISNHIMKEVATFSQGNPQHDDITLVIFKWCQN